MTSPPDGNPKRRTVAERWTLAVSVALIAGVVAAILVSWVSGPSGAPVLQVRQSGAIVHEGEFFRVPFEVRNEGGEAATSVQVVAELMVSGQVAGGGEQVVMFLSSGESDSGEFIFDTDPARGTLSITVASYATP
jgi:uncharacterized protein (TIGR02588 family)